MLFVVITLLCTSVLSQEEGTVRLSGCDDPYKGRVEVFFDGRWGTVCGDGFFLEEAEVVCRQLDLPYNGSAVAPMASFGEGSDPIWLDDVNCDGSEDNISDCNHNELGVHNCLHNRDVGVICSDSPTEGTVRLVNCREPYKGRVEIFHDGQWGTICGNQWDQNDAKVVCRQLGLPYNAAFAVSMTYLNGRGNGAIWLDYVGCDGSEDRITDCSLYRWGLYDSRSCTGHYKDAGVICADSPTDWGNVRLVGGNDTSQGRVEVFFDGQWGTICDDEWDQDDAKVVCRQLGLPYNTSAAFSVAYFGQGSGPIWLDNVKCDGSEDSIDDCTHQVWADHNCDHQADAGVICTDSQKEGTVRLSGCEDPFKGRVEVFLAGQWGTICSNNFGLPEAQVVCRQLGLPYNGSSSIPLAFFGEGSGPIWLNYLNCDGSEDGIAECEHNGLGFLHICSHDNDVGVICSDALTTGTVRLVNCGEPYKGRVQVFYDGQWGTICNRGWDDKDSKVVCRQLGLPDNAAVAYNAAYNFPAFFGPIWLNNVECDGSENMIGDCSHPQWGYLYPYDHCDHFKDVGVICYDSPSDWGNIRLVGGNDTYLGRVEVFFDDQWGTICRDHWDQNDAKVVCRQLGLPYNASVTVKLGHVYMFGEDYYYDFGTASGPIWLDNVLCNGSENSIVECTHNLWASHDCSHYEDVGVICDDDQCASNPCYNGACWDRINGYVCSCFDGWTGDHCEINIDECASNPCNNSGSCIDGIDGYVCRCQFGWTGHACEININECASNPCYNRGSCTDGINGYNCSCTDGWAGDNCGTNIDECSSDPCHNSGSCIDDINSYTCRCLDGWTGDHCGNNIDECASNPCHNNGSCIDATNGYVCRCPDGWAGAYCGININECASNPCYNHGSCTDGINDYICSCRDGWAGDRCGTNVDECASSPCIQSASCTDGINGYVCNCPDGWTGANCGTNIDECVSNPCENSGSCTDGINGYECRCPNGWTGDHCETNINECVTNPCNNGGSCIDGINDYECKCMEGWTGDHCDTETRNAEHTTTTLPSTSSSITDAAESGGHPVKKQNTGLVAGSVIGGILLITLILLLLWFILRRRYQDGSIPNNQNMQKGPSGLNGDTSFSNMTYEHNSVVNPVDSNVFHNHSFHGGTSELDGDRYFS